jgi:hypothetical protein
MRVAYLLGLQIYAGSFETGQQGEMVCCFSQGRHLLGLGSALWHKQAFHWLGVQDIAAFNSI